MLILNVVGYIFDRIWYIYYKEIVANWNKEDKKKYGQAIRKIKLGVYGYDEKHFHTINLTTKLGDDNSQMAKSDLCT